MARLRVQIVYSVADQAVVSITNLAIGLFFVHYASKEDYALYSIAFGIISLALGYANALIYTPMLVTATEREGSARQRHCKAMLAAQFIYFVPIVGIVGSAAALTSRYYYADAALAVFSVIIGLASLTALFQDFFRRYHFLGGRPAVVLGMDVTFALIIFSALFSLWYQHEPAMYAQGTLAYSGAAFIAGAGGFFAAGLKPTLTLGEIREAVTSAWKNGNWALGGVTVTWIQNQCYAYFLAFAGATASLAEANASRLMLSPVSMLGTSLMNVMMPRMATLKARGDVRGTLSQAELITLTLSSILLIYTVIVYIFQNTIIRVVLTREYRDCGIFIIAWALVFLIQIARSNTSGLLQIFRAFRPLTVANVWSALFVVLTTYTLVSYFGAQGSLLAMAGGEIILTVLLWFALRKTLKQGKWK